MTDQEILDNAPKGATHIDNVGDYFKYSLRSRGKSLRSLADIKRIAELEKERAVRDLEQQAKGVEWVLACRELNLSEGEVHTLMDKCNQLRKQDKALKEKE